MTLANSRRPISKIGFGVTSLAGSGNFRHQEKLVKTAIENGITHFDTSPFYGSGDAERILGDILANCHEAVTITTKFGLIPAHNGKGRIIRNILRPLFRRANTLKKGANAILRYTDSNKKTSFRKGDLTSSLDESLKRLRRPIDMFLLHEISLETATDNLFLQELLEAKSNGKVDSVGASGAETDVTQLLNADRLFTVAQVENSLKKKADILQLESTSTTIITYRAIQNGLSDLTFLLNNRPNFKQLWSRELGVEASSDNLVRVLLELSMYENPLGTTLFSTRKPERISLISGVVKSPILGQDGCKLLREIYNCVNLKIDDKSNH